MSLSTIMWVICGGIWGVVIVGAVGLIIVNRIRNRERKGDR